VRVKFLVRIETRGQSPEGQTPENSVVLQPLHAGELQLHQSSHRAPVVIFPWMHGDKRQAGESGHGWEVPTHSPRRFMACPTKKPATPVWPRQCARHMQKRLGKAARTHTRAHTPTGQELLALFWIGLDGLPHGAENLLWHTPPSHHGAEGGRREVGRPWYLNVFFLLHHPQGLGQLQGRSPPVPCHELGQDLTIATQRDLIWGGFSNAVWVRGGSVPFGRLGQLSCRREPEMQAPARWWPGGPRLPSGALASA
jgi:hypothetical protein